MQHSIAVYSLGSIPFIKRSISKEDIIPSLIFFSNGEWHSWFPHNGQLVKIVMIPVEGSYFGERPESRTDQHFRILSFVGQRTFSHEVFNCFRSVASDFQGMAASLAKFELFFENRHRKEYGLSRLVQSEMEYLTVICRSVFDLLQVLARSHLFLLQKATGSPFPKLPTSFADVVIKNGTTQDTNTIMKKYRIPEPLALWYSRHADFFMQLKAIRDSIVHNGKSLEFIFSTEDGFAVQRGTEPFGGLYQWPIECELPNSLVPIRPVMALLVRRTIQASEDLAASLSELFSFRSDLVPSMNLYFRGTNDRQLTVLDDVIDKAAWDSMKLQT